MPETSRRRFTGDEILRMVEAGILAENEPVELIDELIVVPGTDAEWMVSELLP